MPGTTMPATDGHPSEYFACTLNGTRSFQCSGSGAPAQRSTCLPYSMAGSTWAAAMPSQITPKIAA
jgi:hypothetical protein